MSSQPLLGGQPGDSAVKNSYRNGVTFFDYFRGGLVAPDSTTYDSLYWLLNEQDHELQDKFTERWRDHKLQELNFIGTVGALLASCLSSTGAWPDILNNGRDKPWSVRAFWFSGLIFALFSVVTAAQQSLRLHRLSAHKDGLEYIRRCMSLSEGPDGEVRPRRFQVYAWQASLVFLVGSVFCMITGMFILVWVSTSYGPDKPVEDGWWDTNAKMAVTFTVVLGAALTMFFISQTALPTSTIRKA